MLCIGAGLVPARLAADYGAPGGHSGAKPPKGRPYEFEDFAIPSIEMTHGTSAAKLKFLSYRG